MQEIVKNNLKPGLIVVGISGGSDSVCLLHILHSLNVNLVVAHLNHGLRSTESDQDEKFVKNLAEKYGYKFESKKIALKGPSIEEKARNARYEFLNNVKKKHKAKYIAVAHNLDDQIETVLLNLTRGCSLKGLTGMKQEQNGIIRPLLQIPKTEILKYLKKHRLNFRTDKSNKDIRFSRNFLRHKVIPLLKELNPNLQKTIQQNLENLKEIENYINKKAENFIKSNFKDQACNLSKFQKLDPAIQKLVITHMFQKINNSTKNLQKNHIDEILSIIQEGIGRKHKDFQKIRIEILNKNIVFSKTKQ